MFARSLVVCLLLVATPALAEGEASEQDRAAAAALFDAARSSMKAGDYEVACAKLEEARRLAPGAGISFNLGRCYEGLGRTASAWVLYREAASLATGASQHKRAADARQQAKELEADLTRVRITVSEPVADLTIEIDDKPVGRAQWGVPVPVDPRAFTVAARAPGHAPWRTELEAREPGRVIDVAVPPLDAVEPAPAAPSLVQPEPNPDVGEPANTWQPPLGISLLTIGGAGLVAGGVVAAVAKLRADGADCNADNVCATVDDVDARASAVTLGNVATGLLIGGGVVAAVGLTVWLTAASDDEVAVGLSPTGAAFRVRF